MPENDKRNSGGGGKGGNGSSSGSNNQSINYQYDNEIVEYGSGGRIQSIEHEAEKPSDSPVQLDNYDHVLLYKTFDIRHDIDDHAETQHLYGHKTIGFIGGFCLLVGNITGPGLVEISLQFQNGGWVLSLLAFLFMTIISLLSALFIVESMSSLPGNPKFQLRVEFVMLIRFYFGRIGYIVAQIFINVSLQATNIASIVICAQVMDSMLVYIVGKTCGIQIYPDFGHWTCVSNEIDSSSPFENYYMLFTFGYIIILFIIIPLALMNLNDNIAIQIGCFIFMALIVFSWIIIFLVKGLDSSNMPAFGTKQGMTQILGNVMFNYAFITTLPSFVNEVKPDVNIKKTILTSTLFSTVIYLFVGVFGALAYHNMPLTSDILSMINSSSQANFISRLSVYLFPFMVLASSIPVFSIIVRYNLSQNQRLSKRTTTFISVVLPWIVVIPFMTGDGLNRITNYASLFFSSIANFIIPFILYLKSIEFRKKNCMTNDQKNILDQLANETIDWEENETLYLFADVNQFKGLRGYSQSAKRNIAKSLLVITSITVTLVIILNLIPT